MECLEVRQVFDASFDSLITVGNDTGPIHPLDNVVDGAGNSYVTGMLLLETDMDPTVDRADRSDVLTPRGSNDAFLAKYGPNNEFLWARRMGSDYVRSTNANDPLEEGCNLAVDTAGNVYLTGDFVGQADFGSFQLTAVGDSDAFVTKLDTNGNFLWARSWGTTSREFGRGIAVDGSGNVLSVGMTTYLYSNGAWLANGAEIRKYSPSGSLTWTKSISGYGSSANKVVADASGNVYVAGGFAGKVDFNPDPKKTNYVTGSTVLSSGGGTNAYILKLTSAGTFSTVAPLIANTQEASTSNVHITDMAIDSLGSIVIGGNSRGAIDFNPSSTIEYRMPGASTTVSNGFVEKLNPNLGYTWASMTAGGSVNALAIDSLGIYTIGTFSSDFALAGTTYTTHGGSDVVVTMLSSSGITDWAITFGGEASDLGNGIAVDAVGTLYLVGTYYRTVDFDPDPLATYFRTNNAYSDMYLLKLRRR